MRFATDQSTDPSPEFTYGVRPDLPVDEETRDGRGADTVNRLLLHGARFHQRDAVFLCWREGRKGWWWDGTPDWRADREACRVALVLRQRIELEAGERVALWMPLRREWATIERGVWSIGGLTVPLWPDWPPGVVARVLVDSAPAVLFAPNRSAVDRLRAAGGLPESVRAIVLLDSLVEQDEDTISFEKFLEYGGVLDTPERASMWRTTARTIAPACPIACEYLPASVDVHRRVLDHADLMKVIERIQRRVPPRSGAAQLLTDDRPALVSRALLYGAWADGVTRTAFATTPAERERAGKLGARLAACRSSEMATVAALVRGAVPDSHGASGPGRGRARRRWGRNGRQSTTRDRSAEPGWLVVTDESLSAADTAVPTGEGVRLIGRRELAGTSGGGLEPPS